MIVLAATWHQVSHSYPPVKVRQGWAADKDRVCVKSRILVFKSRSSSSSSQDDCCGWTMLWAREVHWAELYSETNWVSGEGFCKWRNGNTIKYTTEYNLYKIREKLKTVDTDITKIGMLPSSRSSCGKETFSVVRQQTPWLQVCRRDTPPSLQQIQFHLFSFS